MPSQRRTRGSTSRANTDRESRGREENEEDTTGGVEEQHSVATDGRASGSDDDYRFAENLPEESTRPEQEYQDYAASSPDSSEAPDVLLDVPVVKVDEINFDLEDLRARVSLQAEVLDLLKLNVGADVALGRVHLDIKGIEAQALLKVRLDNVAAIVDRVLTTIDRNPEILENITSGVGQAVEEVGEGAGEAVEDVGGGAREAVGELGRGAGSAVEDVGEGAGSAVEDVGEGAGEAVEDVGEGAGSAVEDVGETVEDVGEGAGSAVEDVGEGAGSAVEDVGETVEDIGEGAGDAVEGVGEGAGEAVEDTAETASSAAETAQGAVGSRREGGSRSSGGKGRRRSGKGSQRSSTRRRGTRQAE
jgi:hypothetical protein